MDLRLDLHDGFYLSGVEFGDEAIAVAERTRDPWLIAWMKMLRGLVAINNGESATAPFSEIEKELVTAIGRLRTARVS